MRQTAIWVGIAWGFLTTVETKADGLLHRLSEDGAWVRYIVTVRDSDGDMTGNMILRSVGRASVEGQQCRWIELQFETDRLKAITKLLIPETHLKTGQSPLDHLVRGWLKLGDRATRKLDDMAAWGLLPYLLTPPLRDSKELETAEVVEWAQGSLKCAIRTGNLKLKPMSPTGRRLEEDVSYEVGLHEEIPFGVAIARLSIRLKRDGEWEKVGTVTIAAADTGTDARSQLPEFQ